MEKVTTLVGNELRCFLAITCAAFETTELEKEAAARGRKQKRRQVKRTANSSQPITADPVEPEVLASKAPAKQKKRKVLNLSIYKVHALGDYARTIRIFGPTDSYSTQIVSDLQV
jgi:hypothetical protein